MKKIISFTLITFIFFFSYSICGIGYSQTISREKAEQMLKGEKAMLRNHDKNISLLKPLVEVKEIKYNRAVSKKSWFSSNPKDFDVLISSKWIFNYAIVSIFTDTYVFDSIVQTDSSDGSVYLTCRDQYNDKGYVWYTELPSDVGGGYGYSIIIDGYSLRSFYFFKVDSPDSTDAEGFYQFKYLETDEYSDVYPMSILKIDCIYTEEDMQNMINTLLTWDINNDKKIGLTEAIHILRNASLLNTK